MPKNLREDLINQLSELSLSLSDSLERVGEADLESNRAAGKKPARGKQKKASPRKGKSTTPADSL